MCQYHMSRVSMCTLDKEAISTEGHLISSHLKLNSMTDRVITVYHKNEYHVSNIHKVIRVIMYIYIISTPDRNRERLCMSV